MNNMGLRNLRDSTQKFTKGQAYYVDDAFLKGFRCANCRFYDAENKKCEIVSEEGTPGPGRISPEGSCALYNARPVRIQMMQMLWGRGFFDGLAPETARATAFMITYASLDEEPPPDLRDKALINPDKLNRRMDRIGRFWPGP